MCRWMLIREGGRVHNSAVLPNSRQRATQAGRPARRHEQRLSAERQDGGGRSDPADLDRRDAIDGPDPVEHLRVSVAAVV